MPRHPQLEEIGKNIRKARKGLHDRARDDVGKKKWSQDGFATELGIARSYFGGVERGERNLSVLKLLEIAVALEIEPVDLFPSLGELRRLARKRATGRRSTT